MRICRNIFMQINNTIRNCEIISGVGGGVVGEGGLHIFRRLKNSIKNTLRNSISLGEGICPPQTKWENTCLPLIAIFQTLGDGRTTYIKFQSRIMFQKYFLEVWSFFLIAYPWYQEGAISYHKKNAMPNLVLYFTKSCYLFQIFMNKSVVFIKFCILDTRGTREIATSLFRWM